MTNEEFLKDVCPNHTDKYQWNKSELMHILELHEKAITVTRCCETLGTKCEQPMHLHNFKGCANCGGD